MESLTLFKMPSSMPSSQPITVHDFQHLFLVIRRSRSIDYHTHIRILCNVVDRLADLLDLLPHVLPIQTMGFIGEYPEALEARDLLQAEVCFRRSLLRIALEL